MEKTVTFQQLTERPDIAADPKLQKIYTEYSGLLRELAKKELPERLIASVNQDIAALNALSNGSELGKAVRSRQRTLIKLLEKELKIVPKNYYRNLWMLLGMTAFGLPLGTAFGLSVGNIGLLSLGLPVGMAIGMAVGMNMDKKALAEGRQLDIELNML